MTEEAKSHLNNREFQESEELLAKYENIFAVDSEDHRQTNRVYHCTDTGNI